MRLDLLFSLCGRVFLFFSLSRLNFTIAESFHKWGDEHLITCLDSNNGIKWRLSFSLHSTPVKRTKKSGLVTASIRLTEVRRVSRKFVTPCPPRRFVLERHDRVPLHRVKIGETGIRRRPYGGGWTEGQGEEEGVQGRQSAQQNEWHPTDKGISDKEDGAGMSRREEHRVTLRSNRVRQDPGRHTEEGDHFVV